MIQNLGDKMLDWCENCKKIVRGKYSEGEEVKYLFCCSDCGAWTKNSKKVDWKTGKAKWEYKIEKI